jgi:SAM-dependent methyltransferase
MANGGLVSHVETQIVPVRRAIMPSSDGCVSADTLYNHPMPQPTPPEPYRDLLHDALSDSDRFVQATFRGVQHGGQIPWREVTLRPVEIRGERLIQVSRYTDRQHTAANIPPQELPALVDQLLALPFKSIAVQRTHETLAVQFSRKGKPLVHRQGRAEPLPAVSADHDRPKERLLTIDPADPFWQEIGLATRDGRIRADMQSKVAQVEQFLRALAGTGVLDGWGNRPIRIADLGCGSAHLTFAAFRWLREGRGMDVSLVGVDLRADLMQRHIQRLQEAGWEGMQFVRSRISDWQPEQPPDIVIALHACDTATDEALAQGVRHGSALILAAPCCHHHLHAQLARTGLPAVMQPIARHAILREELITVLTDAWRALLLRRAGYRTDVVAFVSAEHTPKNALIRAVRIAGSASADRARFDQEHADLTAFWSVTPRLAELLPEPLP